jgi:uncharacterized protein YoxC
MTSSNLLELAIIAFIVVGIGLSIWRGGARNPVGTGSLDKRLSKIGGEVASMKTKVGEIEGRVEAFEATVASVDDILRLERAITKMSEALPDLESRQRALSDKIGEHAATSAATGAQVTHINRQVDLIYQTLVTKGMGK